MAILSCPGCGYPISVEAAGQTSTCANCHQKVESIIRGVSIPLPLFTFGLGLLVGILSMTGVGRRTIQKGAKRLE